MLVQVLLTSLIDFFNAIVGWLPIVTALPTIMGFDVDNALSTGVGEARTFFNTFWPFQVLFEGFLVLLGYYAIKMLLKLLLGSRTPGAH